MIWHFMAFGWLIHLHPVNWNWGTVEYEPDGHCMFMWGPISFEEPIQ